MNNKQYTIGRFIVGFVVIFIFGYLLGRSSMRVVTDGATYRPNVGVTDSSLSTANQPQYSIENFGRPKASDVISYVMPVTWKPGETVIVESIDVHEDTVSTRPHQEAGQPRLTIKAFDGLKKSELEKGAEKITQDKRSLYTFDKWSNSDSIFWLIEDDKAEVTYLFEFHKGSENVASNIIESIKFGRDRT